MLSVSNLHVLTRCFSLFQIFKKLINPQSVLKELDMIVVHANWTSRVTGSNFEETSMFSLRSLCIQKCTKLISLSNLTLKTP